jgi:hypothetical protein
MRVSITWKNQYNGKTGQAFVIPQTDEFAELLEPQVGRGPLQRDGSARNESRRRTDRGVAGATEGQLTKRTGSGPSRWRRPQVFPVQGTGRPDSAP